MSPTAVVQLTGRGLELVRHPVDGRVVAFEQSDDAFAFALSLELQGASTTGTVIAPTNAVLHMLDHGVTAFDLATETEEAA